VGTEIFCRDSVGYTAVWCTNSPIYADPELPVGCSAGWRTLSRGCYSFPASLFLAHSAASSIKTVFYYGTLALVSYGELG